MSMTARADDTRGSRSRRHGTSKTSSSRNNPSRIPSSRGVANRQVSRRSVADNLRRTLGRRVPGSPRQANPLHKVPAGSSLEQGNLAREDSSNLDHRHQVSVPLNHRSVPNKILRRAPSNPEEGVDRRVRQALADVSRLVPALFLRPPDNNRGSAISARGSRRRINASSNLASRALARVRGLNSLRRPRPVDGLVNGRVRLPLIPASPATTLGLVIPVSRALRMGRVGSVADLPLQVLRGEPPQALQLAWLRRVLGSVRGMRRAAPRKLVQWRGMVEHSILGGALVSGPLTTSPRCLMMTQMILTATRMMASVTVAVLPTRRSIFSATMMMISMTATRSLMTSWPSAEPSAK